MVCRRVCCRGRRGAIEWTRFAATLRRETHRKHGAESRFFARFSALQMEHLKSIESKIDAQKFCPDVRAEGGTSAIVSRRHEAEK